MDAYPPMPPTDLRAPANSHPSRSRTHIARYTVEILRRDSEDLLHGEIERYDQRAAIAQLAKELQAACDKGLLVGDFRVKSREVL